MSKLVIQKTSQINDWRFPSWQRPDRESHQWSLAEKMIENGFDESRPIVLISHPGSVRHPAGTYVVDGRQRVGAAKKVQQTCDDSFEVAFIVVDGEIDDERRWLALGSDQANWTMDDHMHFYADHGYDAYIWATWLCERFAFMTAAGVARVAQGIAGLGSQYEGKQGSSKAFKQGAFSPSSEFRELVQGICQEVEELAQHMPKIATSEGMASYTTVRSAEGFDYSIMRSRAESLGRRFRLMPRRSETVELLQDEIYNYRTRQENRIQVER